MSRKRLVQLGSPQAFAGGTNFSFTGVPLFGSITEIILFLRTDVTTTTETPFSDYWDRILSSFGIGWGDGSILQSSRMPATYHFTRLIKRLTTKRPTVLGNSVTNGLTNLATILHFGMRPRLPNGEWDPFDLTAGIPYVPDGNVVLSGTWSAAAGSMGTNDTINTGTRLDVYAHVVEPEGGEDARAYQPAWVPNWSTADATPTGTSAAFGTSQNEPSGDFLRSILLELRNGTNLPRTNDVISSLEVYDNIASRSLIRFGGQGEIAAAGESASIITQIGVNGWPPTETPAGAGGVPAVTGVDDAGLIPLQLWRYSDRAHPLAGLDLRGLPDGAIQTRMGVLDATGTQHTKFYEKYKPNLRNPDTAAYVGGRR